MNLLMLGFEQQISVVGSDRSSNCATTTAHSVIAKYFFSAKERKGFLLFWQVVLFSFFWHQSVACLSFQPFFVSRPIFADSWQTLFISFCLAWPGLPLAGLVWFGLPGLRALNPEIVGKAYKGVELILKITFLKNTKTKSSQNTLFQSRSMSHQIVG